MSTGVPELIGEPTGDVVAVEPETAAEIAAPTIGGHWAAQSVYGGFVHRKIVDAPAAAAVKASGSLASSTSGVAPAAGDPERVAIVTVSPRAASRSATGRPMRPAPTTR